MRSPRALTVQVLLPGGVARHQPGDEEVQGYRHQRGEDVEPDPAGEQDHSHTSPSLPVPAGQPQLSRRISSVASMMSRSGGRSPLIIE